MPHQLIVILGLVSTRAIFWELIPGEPVATEADNKATAEQARREKHVARVIEAERELLEAVKKSEGLEQSLVGKESNSPKLSKPQRMLGKKPEVL